MQENMTSDLEFERKITQFSTEAQFLARQIRGIRQNCVTEEKIIADQNKRISALESQKHESRISDLEKRDNKTWGTIAGIAGFVGTMIGAALVYIRQSLR